MRNRSVILSVLFVLMFSAVFSQNIRFRCIQVIDSADVVLYWERNAIPLTYQIEVYASLSLTGTYLSLSTINESDIDSFLHENAQAHLQQHFYYLKASPKNDDPSLPVYYSDTLENLSLVLGRQKGVANLYFKQPMKFATSDSIKLDRKTDGVWDVLQTLHNITYNDTVNDTITFCGKFTYYRIRYDKGGGCENISYAVSDLLSDDLPPDLARLDTVSLNQVTQKTELGWERSASADAYGYIIYFFTGIWITIDTLYGAENTFYIDNKYSAENESQAYRIATIDTCLNASPLGDIHNTLFLTASIEKCDSIVFFRWNSYQNMPEGVDSFRIYASVNKGAFNIIASVTGNELKYDYKHVNTAYDYQFFVQAVNKKLGFTSSSNIVDVAFNRNIGNGSVTMRYVSVVDNDYLEIVAHVDDTVEFNDMFLYKSVDNGKSFTFYDKLAKTKQAESYVFEDEKVDVERFNYYYYVSLTDECDMEYVFSDTSANILLTEVDGELSYNCMEWTEYPWFASGLEAYEVQRKTQVESDFSLITSMMAGEVTYNDFVWNLSEEGGVFYYKILAVESASSRFQDQSESNTIKIVKEPTSYIPNAFAPDGVNKIFKPVCVYVDADSYDFKIYNRWGELLFQTKDVQTGWDGDFNGKPAPQGVYTYVITYKLDEKKSVVKRGTVLLMR